MSSKVVKFSIIGFGLYVIFAGAVISLYEDVPDQMNWQDRQTYNNRYINKLTIDDPINKDSIIKVLGSPDLTEAKIVDSTTYQVLFYRTVLQKSDGITTKDECTPLLFKDGKLIAWGKSAFEQFDSIKV